MEQQKMRQTVGHAPVSVFVLTHNHEYIIKNCLSPLENWARQLILVDAESKDNTVNAALSSVDCVLQVNFVPETLYYLNLCEQYAICDWLLIINGNDVLSEEVLQEIENFVSDENSKNIASALMLPQYTKFLGRIFDMPENLRLEYRRYNLIQKGKCKWPLHVNFPQVIDGPALTASADDDKSAIISQAPESIKRFCEYIDIESDSLAEFMKKYKAHCSWKTMAQDFADELAGYFDYAQLNKHGAQGFLYAMCNAMVKVVANMKLAEMHIKEGWHGESYAPPSAAAFLQYAAEQASLYIKAIEAEGRKPPEPFEPIAID